MSKTEHTGGRVLLALGVLLAALFVLSFCLGRYGVDAGTTCRILLSPLLPLEPTWTDHEYTAVMNIRLPRIVLACLVGCCLSSAGAAYQGVFQNPMASPDVLGASSGASFGAALAILAGVLEMAARTVMGQVFVPLFGFTAACFASPVAWISADLFLIPAAILCIRHLRKLYPDHTAAAALRPVRAEGP